MKQSVAREVLIVAGTALLAVVLLLTAGLLGIAFTTETYLWSFVVLYVARILVWAAKTVRRGNAASGY